ncbi:hypothetical protein DACRYDRAFT_16428 [Dacryopinax primogenitus]|uniref:ABC transporter domain-containing protein n=1 Tax=Dacryopinax primogenitus (strain DJM 731) TaxID=1858805 RepID=M5FXA4_DACPD|nr:uncharacterized protein DACRYDRAFT_16428 [Dacryopinax primogenitus]EJU01079.1 hypothetical protein DACRYDRAFT_16428 [Dacryopinax primogenitus]
MILAAPGKLLATGSPVHLKLTLGDGYIINLHRASEAEDEKGHVIRLNSKEPGAVARVLRIIEDRKIELGITRYDVHASSLEDVFLGLMIRTSVQAMVYSNGLTPLGLWLGLLFEIPSIVIISSIISLVFAYGQESPQFYHTGILWVILTLYGMTAALFSFCVTLFITSGLAAFAIVAGYQVIIFLLYTAAYLLTLTFQLSANNSQTLTAVHFAMALLSPIVSVVRAAFVSVNLFNLLCDGTGNYTTSPPGDVLKFGGPIVYLIVYGILCFALLIGIDSGFFTTPKLLNLLRRRIRFGTATPPERETGADVLVEAKRVRASNDALRVIGLSKHFASMTIPAVDDVSFGVNAERMALLGPNGAGKTTTFNMIVRGSIFRGTGIILRL